MRIDSSAANFVVLTVLLLGVAACDKPMFSKETATDASMAAGGKSTCSTDVAEWTEEVNLFNGQQVLVWRRAVACKGGFPVSSRGRDLEFELKYEPMRVHWKAPSGLQPASFEIIDGVPYLTLYVMTGGHCRDQPSTTPLARVVKWVDGKWIDVPIEQAPFDRALLNLYTDYWGAKAKDDAKGLIPARGKHTGWAPDMTLARFFGMKRNQCFIYEERRGPFAAPPPAWGASTPHSSTTNR